MSYDFDGSQWIIELKKGDQYHVIDRWSPTEGAVYELGMMLVGMSGTGNALGEVY